MSPVHWATVDPRESQNKRSLIFDEKKIPRFVLEQRYFLKDRYNGVYDPQHDKIFEVCDLKLLDKNIYFFLHGL